VKSPETTVGSELPPLQAVSSANAMLARAAENFAKNWHLCPFKVGFAEFLQM
jgi:hypothetical protein